MNLIPEEARCKNCPHWDSLVEIDDPNMGRCLHKGVFRGPTAFYPEIGTLVTGKDASCHLNPYWRGGDNKSELPESFNRRGIIRMTTFTDQKQRIATEEECNFKWSNCAPGEKFRCYLCGHKFVPGDIWRWVSAVPMNFMVCGPCDGEDVRERWAKHVADFNSEKFWALRRRHL